MLNNKKEYYNTNKWVGILNNDYGHLGIKLKPRQIHQLFGYFKVPKREVVKYGRKITEYKVSFVQSLRKNAIDNGFIYAMDNLSKYGEIDGVDKYIDSNNIGSIEHEKPSASFKNGENDNDLYSQHLIKQYQTESRKKIHVNEDVFNRLFEDVFMTNADSNKNKVQLKYAKNSSFNRGNLNSNDMVKTDKMDNDNNDTYEVPLKGGLVSYNITSINGTEVMHYFKRIFDKQKTYIKISDGNEAKEYELEMQNAEFRQFMEQFVSKVNRVVEYKVDEFRNNDKDVEINGVAIYPVPSSSNFNIEMAKRMRFNQLGGFTPTLINQDILKKDLSKLEKDNDFIEKNKEYYDSKYSPNDKENYSHMNYLNQVYSRFNGIENAKKYIDAANEAAKKLMQKYYTRKENSPEKFYVKLNDLYMEYYNAVNQIKKMSEYYDEMSQKIKSVQLEKIAKAIKYSKGPSIEKRSGEVYELLKNHKLLKGVYTNTFVPICFWQPVNFQIKSMSNDIRMGLKNYFQPNSDSDMVNKEMENSSQKVYVVFDDNVSGGATLSDICYQLQQLGAKYIVPITFGKMREQWSQNMKVINKPKQWNF